ncbi:hypothetical protein AB0J52_36350, partial [Spirillospora sp. NPDC049652]
MTSEFPGARPAGTPGNSRAAFPVRGESAAAGTGRAEPPPPPSSTPPSAPSSGPSAQGGQASSGGSAAAPAAEEGAAGLAELLLRLERERRSGEVGCGMEGRVLLSEGLVCRAESRRATPLAMLRTADGPVEEQPWWPGNGGAPDDPAAGPDEASPLKVYALA